jgi:hypothetical protein
MKFTILKLTAFAMLATASSVYASEDHAVRSLRGSTSASDEDSADEELYDWSRRPNGTPWSVQPNGQPWSARPNGTPWSVQPNGQPWWNGNNRSDLQTCRSNCQCPGGEEDSYNTVNFPLFDICVQIRI